MRSFVFRFIIGTLIGLIGALAAMIATGEFFYWMPPIVGMFYGTWRSLNDEDDTRA